MLRISLMSLCSVLLSAGFVVADAVEPPRTVVVAVGVDRYEMSGWSTLPSCVNDANGFLDHLQDFDEERWPERIFAGDDKATKEFCRNSIQSYAMQLKAGDVFVYFHSSHGGRYSSTAPKSFICCYDDRYHDEELAEDIAGFATGVTVIVIVDACYSGGLFRGEYPEAALRADESFDEPWPFARNVIDHLAATPRVKGAVGEVAGPDVAFITACDYNQVCYAGTPYSVFTKYLLDGFLQGDADQSGSVSFFELYQYAKPRAKSAQPRQDAQAYNETLLQKTTVVGSLEGREPKVRSSSGGGGCMVARVHGEGDGPWGTLLSFVFVVVVVRRRGNANVVVRA